MDDRERAPAGAAADKETGRIEAFSDGVFAIAITLLVLDLRLPSEAAGTKATGLGTALLELWPSYLAFGISFAFIGIMWINHHRLFTHIRRADSLLLILNLLLLLGVTVVPFPTAVLADQLGGDPADPAVAAAQQIATLIYSGLFVFIAIAFNALWRYAAAGNRLLDSNADPRAVARITRQYLFGPILYALAFALAFVNIWPSLLLSLLLAIFFALPGPPLERTAH